jgi:acetyl esterase/lipase
MAKRPGVATASVPVAAIDAAGLAQHLAAALARVPFRRPLRGPSSAGANLATSVTREVLRSFMGYVSSLPIPEFRSIELLLDELCRVAMPPVVRSFDVEQRNVVLGGVPGIHYQPRGREPAGAILYLHGGGYIGTSPNMYAFFTARLCRATGCSVFVADYRLAPEFPYPAAVEDAASALAALAEAGTPPERLFVAGDSGGGGVAHSLMVEVGRGRGACRRPAGLILFSPEVDLRMEDTSITANAERDILPWNIPAGAYLRGIDPDDARVTALNADLSTYPPTFVSWGGDEMFRDPIRRFAERLGAEGVPVHAHEAEGMFHVFQILMPWAEDSRDVYREVELFSRRLLDAAPPAGEVAAAG